MKNIIMSPHTISNFLLSVMTYLIGGFDNLIVTLLIFMFLDYLTGVLKAIYKKKLSSKVGFKGIIKKLGYIFIIIIATLFDYIVSNGEMSIRNLTLYFFIANEAISILENWSLLGLPLPKKLTEVFEQIQIDKK